MRRRAMLRAGLGLAGLAGFGSVAATPSIRVSNGSAMEGFRPVAERTLPGTADCRVSPDGTVVFVAVGDGFAAVARQELSVMAEERTIEVDRENGPLSGIADLAVDGDRLLVPGPANPRPGTLTGFALFDVSDLAEPVQVAFYETDFSIHNASLSDGRAYLTADNSLVIVDVAEDDPVELGRWSLADADPRWEDVAHALWVLHDIRIRGDLAVLSQWDAGTWLVDVGSPEAVTVIGHAGGRPVEELAAVPADDVQPL